MADTVVYASSRSARGLWQRHLVYADRVELGTLFGRMVVPLDHIEDIWVRGPLWGGLGAGSWRAVKLDWADVYEHVALDKSGGWFRTVHFTHRTRLGSWRPYRRPRTQVVHRTPVVAGVEPNATLSRGHPPAFSGVDRHFFGSPTAFRASSSFRRQASAWSF
jgi:hypothetical protein